MILNTALPRLSADLSNFFAQKSSSKIGSKPKLLPRLRTYGQVPGGVCALRFVHWTECTAFFLKVRTTGSLGVQGKNQFGIRPQNLELFTFFGRSLGLFKINSILISFKKQELTKLKWNCWRMLRRFQICESNTFLFNLKWIMPVDTAGGELLQPMHWLDIMWWSFSLQSNAPRWC